VIIAFLKHNIKVEKREKGQDSAPEVQKKFGRTEKIIFASSKADRICI